MKNITMRRCIGCMTSKDKRDLIRIAGYEGKVSLDKTGKAKGRGVYLCPEDACLKLAIKKKAISRALKMEIASEELERLYEELRIYEK